MEVQHLPEDVKNVIKSGMQLNCAKDCILELVYNSLDANSSSIAIRINLIEMFIQVVDNGCGISRENLQKLGLSNMTNKCTSLKELKKPRMFIGYKGEALHAIKTLSEKVMITSRIFGESDTFNVILENNKEHEINLIKHRPSEGTTVTVYNFMQNLPVRRNRINADLDLEDIRQSIQAIAVINPKVSLSLRNNVNKKIIIDKNGYETIEQALISFYGDLQINDLFSCKLTKDKFKIESVFCKKTTDVKNLQYIFVNKRPVACKIMQKHILKLLAKSHYFDKNNLKCKKTFPIYIISICCPPLKFCIDNNSTKTKVEFNDINIVLECLTKIVEKFFESISEELQENNSQSCYTDNETCALFIQKPTKSNFTKEIEIRNELNHFGDNMASSGIFKSNVLLKRKPSSGEDVLVKKACLDIIKTNNKRKHNENCPKKEYKETKIDKSLRTYFSSGVEKHNLFTNKKDKRKRTINLKKTAKKGYIKKNEEVVKNFMKNYKMRPEEAKNTEKSEDIFIEPSDETNNATLDKENENFLISNSKNVLNNENSKKETTKINSNNNIFHDINTITINDYLIKDLTNTNKPIDNNSFNTEENREKQPQKDLYNVNGGNAKSRLSFNDLNNICESKLCSNSNICATKPNTYIDDAETILKNYKTGKDFVIDLFLKSTALFTNDKELDNESEIQDKNTRTNEKNTLIQESQIESKSLQTKNENSHRRQFEMKSWENNIENECISNQRSKLTFFNEMTTTKKSVQTINKTIFEADKIYENPVQKNKNLKKDNLCKLGFIKKCNKVQKNTKTTAVDCSKRNRHKEKLKTDQIRKQNTKHTVSNTINCQNFYGNVYLSSNNDEENAAPKNIPKMMQQKYKNNGAKPKIQRNRQPAKNSNYNNINKRSTNNLNTKPKDVKDNSNFENSLNYNISKNYDISSIFSDNLQNNNNKENYSCFNLQEMNEDLSNITNNIDNTVQNSSENISLVNSNIENEHDVFSNSDFFENDLFSNNFEDDCSIKEKSMLTIYQTSLHGNTVENNNFLTNNNNLGNDWNSTNIEDDIQTIVVEDSAMNLFDNQAKNIENNVMSNNMSPPVLSNENIFSSVENNWISALDGYGKTYYVNAKTGLTTFKTPKKNEMFSMKKRNDFIPKGYSPLLKEKIEIAASLSPISKQRLHKQITCHLSEELEVVKWQNYVTNTDFKSFFDKLYKIKSNKFENIIPEIKNDKLVSHFREETCPKFDMNILKNIKIIGQLDKKFIVALITEQNLLVLFDQHAVDERIQLEKLFSGYTYEKNNRLNLTSTSLKSSLQINLIDYDLDIIKNNLAVFEAIGLSFKINENRLEVIKIPTCYYNKFIKTNDENELYDLIRMLINEQIDMIINVRGNSTKIPKAIRDIINMEACRGAIKFGDVVTHEECKNYINSLILCNLPFQCAHGRPTMKPIVKIQEKFKNTSAKRLNFKKLTNL